jgi:flagellar basal-body rod modification protein FlgD
MIGNVGLGVSNTASANKSGGLGKEDFLKLMLAQLKAQDPLNPQDGAEYVAQLAQFTSVERLMNIEEGLGNVAMAALSTNATMAAGLIGKHVRLEGNGIEFDGKSKEMLDFELGKDAQSVTITIKDEKGDVVDTVKMSGKEGTNSHEWTGQVKGDDGETKTLPDGKYTFSIEALDEQGKSVDAKTTTVVEVKAVHFTAMGVPELKLESGRQISMSEVSEVLE